MGIKNYLAIQLVTYANQAALPASANDGQLAMALDDGSGAPAVFVWDSGAVAWILCTGSAAASAVAGPASATDNAIARYDGVTGKLLKDSLKSIIEDDGRATFDTTSRIADTPIFLVNNDGADLFTVIMATAAGAAAQIKGDATNTKAILLVEAFDNTGTATLNVGLSGTGAISVVADIAGALAKIENTLAGPFVIGNNAGLLRLETLSDHQFDLPSNDGSDKVAVRDSDDAEVASIDSDGDASFNSVTSTGVIEGSATKTTVDTTDVSNPPTDAELDAIYGTPAAVGAGFMSYIDDNGAGANFYQVTSDGTNWWIFTGTKAV